MEKEYQVDIWAVFKIIAATLAASLSLIKSKECIIACYC